MEFFSEVVRFARKHGLVVCHDNAYSEIYFDRKQQPSFLQAPGAREVGVEFHSLSKTFNMAGWRIGFAVGNPEIIKALADIKTNIDSGVFNACQIAAAHALDNFEPYCGQLRGLIQERRDMLVPALHEAGFACSSPDASYYVWARVPSGETSESCVMRLIMEKGVVAMPGSGFGRCGDGYVRFALCLETARLAQAAKAIAGRP